MSRSPFFLELLRRTGIRSGVCKEMIHQPRGKWYRIYIDLAYKFERFDFSYHLYHGDCAVGDAGYIQRYWKISEDGESFLCALESCSNSTARECKNDAISESCSHEKVFNICWSSLGPGSSLWIKLLSAITTGLITIPPFSNPGQKRDAEIWAPAALFP